MEPISGMISGAQPLPSAAGITQPPAARRPGAEGSGRPPKPVTDEYVPGEPPEPSGRYWPVRDENGRPGIYFDDPERPEDAPGAVPERDGGPEGPARKAAGRPEETCTGDTGRVDREIERLKRRRDQLEQQLAAEPDGARTRELKRQLAQVERELSQKDNDAYRRRHTVFS